MQKLADFIRREPVMVRTLVMAGLAAVIALTPAQHEAVGTLVDAGLGLMIVLVGKSARDKVTPTETLDAATELSSMGAVGAFAVQAVRQLLPTLIPGVTLARSLAAIMPVISPIANQVLTPERQAEVTGLIHEALRGANLLRRVNLE